MVPLDELKQLGMRIESASDIVALKPIYDRLDDIARAHSDDFEVQLFVAELRERLVHKGVSLRRAGQPKAVGRRFLPALLSKPGEGINIRRVLGIGAAIGVAAWIILFVALVQIARQRNNTPGLHPPSAEPGKPAAGTVAVDILTEPRGATIQINNETKCTSNCRINLPPGNYQVTAMLDGFDPVATGVTVIPGAPINVSLTLINQFQTVRVFTDLPSGRVALDGKAAGNLVDGQLVLDRVKNGRHKLAVTSANNEAVWEFTLAAGKPPAIDGKIAVNNLIAVMVSSMGSDAHVATSSPTPLKLNLNGKPQGEVGQQGLDLKGVPTGDQQLSIGQGPDERKMIVAFGPMPTLTAYLKSDVDEGTLVISTGEDGVSVFVNGRDLRRKTLRGQIRVPALGHVAVRVAKEGFEPVAEKLAEVKRGEEVRLAFTLKPLPQVASLQVRGAAPGTSVLVDDRLAGRVALDGTLSVSNVTPGDRIIELRREGFVSKRLPKNLRAGEITLITAAEAALAAAVGTIHLITTPPDAQITYRRVDETQSKSAPGNTLRLEPGNYVFTAKAPSYSDRTERVPVVAGETRNVELALARERVVAPPPPKPAPVTTSAVDWSGWSKQGHGYVRKGGNRVPVRSGVGTGTITFTAQLLKRGGLFRGGKLRWYLEDSDRLSLFEIDKKHFYARGEDEQVKVPHEELDEGKKYTVQIEITPERIVQRLRVAGRWVTLGSQKGASITNGKFGFVIPGGDEIAVSDVSFAPK